MTPRPLDVLLWKIPTERLPPVGPNIERPEPPSVPIAAPSFAVMALSPRLDDKADAFTALIVTGARARPADHEIEAVEGKFDLHSYLARKPIVIASTPPNIGGHVTRHRSLKQAIRARLTFGTATNNILSLGDVS